jgi:thioredoxin-like negative regulator of GroEL
LHRAEPDAVRPAGVNDILGLRRAAIVCDNLTATAGGPNMPQAIEQAIELHRQGRLNDAERRYREVLRASPRDFDALHMLGVLKLQQGHPADALRYSTRPGWRAISMPRM